MTSPLSGDLAQAEAEWLEGWAAGPSESLGNPLTRGTDAPDSALLDDSGTMRRLSEFWSTGPALVMFWRHFGCSCGADRAKRLRNEYDSYREVGLTPVIVSQGEPGRSAKYREEHGIPCPILSDPDHNVYRSFGVGHWAVEQVLYDAPSEWWSHPQELGVTFQNERRADGRPPVDDPWRATAEFVVGANGKVRLSHAYQHCEDYPEPLVLLAAAQLAQGPVA